MRPHRLVPVALVISVVAASLTTLATAPVSAAPVDGASAASPSSARAARVHDITVTGDDVATYPAFATGTERYAIATGPGTGGRVTVTATTSDPAGVVLVDGQLAPGGARTLTGLTAGDEVAVFIDDSDGRAAYSFVYLPDQFPTLERVTPASGVPTREHVMLTLGLWVTPSPFFETAVDANGVPAVLMTNTVGSSMDLKRQPNGNFSVSRGSVRPEDGGAPGYPNSQVIELDEQFREVGRYRAKDLQHTDSHDAMLLSDGSRYFMSYEPDDETGLLDAVIQHESASGEVLFRWDSRAFLGETTAGSSADYAHINSFEIMADGNLLVSFRHLSSVFKIARHDGPGYDQGSVIWKLGGRDSDFAYRTSAGEPGGVGPCAQHTAIELPNGNVLVFDNGSSRLAQKFCVDPDDPTGPPVEHVPTRMAQWSLDESAGTATLVRDHRVNGRHAIFAGSVQPFDDGSSMVGWASSVEAMASELDPAGNVVWELRDAAPLPGPGEPGTRYFTYRAFALDLPDKTSPEVSLGALPGGAVYVEGQSVAPPALTCTDRGGSSLQTCSVEAVDTRTPGTRTVTARATDGDGNVTTARRTYRVVRRYRPDAAVRALGTTRVVGTDRYGAVPAQQVRLVSRRASGPLRPVVAVVRVRNAGARPDRIALTRVSRSRDFAVRLVGRRTSPVLAPGQTWSVRLRVVPRRSAVRGDRVRVRVVATSTRRPARRDTVWVLTRRR